MKKLLLCLVSLSLFVCATHAQPRSAGVRLSYFPAFFYQHSFAKSTFTEADLTLQYNVGFFSLLDVNNNHILYNKKFQNFDINLFLGYGAGIGMNVYNGYNVDQANLTISSQKKFMPIVGLVGRAGIEMELTQLPLNITLDMKPFIPIVGGSFLYTYLGMIPSFSVAYRF